MLASSAFVNSMFTLAQDTCTAMNNWTQNKQLRTLTTEHKISATRWVSAHGTGESTILALLGALFWNGRWNIGLWWCSTLYSDEVIDYSQEIWQTLHGQFFIYRVIHESVKHFKNSQQINYSADHGSSYADRERNSPSFFLHISQMLNVSTFGNTADIYAIVHLVPHVCQLITVDHEPQQRWYGCENLETTGEWRHKDSVLHKPPEEKVARG